VRSGDTLYLDWWKGRRGARKLFEPGWLEVRVKASDVRGVMSEVVLWTDYQAIPSGTSDRFLGEIDLLEARGLEPTTAWSATHHIRYPNWQLPTINHSQGGPYRIVRQKFHTYTVHWSADFVRIYVDGRLRHERNMGGDPTRIFGYPMALTMGCWVATTNDGWAGARGVDYRRLPTQMEVDYVRYYAPRR